MEWVIEGEFEFCATVGGYRLKRYFNSEPIISIQASPPHGPEIKLGQVVFSNGRLGIEEGTIGIVVGILTPYENTRTSDVIKVHFEGHHSPHHMKFKDLDLFQLKSA